MKPRPRFLLAMIAGLLAVLALGACSGGDDDDDSADDDLDDDADDDTTVDDDDTDDDTTTDDDADDDSADDDTAFDPNVTVDKAYCLDIALSDWTEPSGVGDIIGYYVPVLLFGVTAATTTTLEVRAAIGVEEEKDPTQDLCALTTDFTGTVDESGQFAIGPADYRIRIQGVDAHLWEATATGTFRADGSGYDDGVLNGLLDARELLDFLFYDPDTTCLLVAAFGSECVACPSDSEVYCVEIQAEGFSAEVVNNLTIEDVDEEDLGPECDDDTSVDDDTVDDDTV